MKGLALPTSFEEASRGLPASVIKLGQAGLHLARMIKPPKVNINIVLKQPDGTTTGMSLDALKDEVGAKSIRVQAGNNVHRLLQMGGYLKARHFGVTLHRDGSIEERASNRDVDPSHVDPVKQALRSVKDWTQYGLSIGGEQGTGATAKGTKTPICAVESNHTSASQTDVLVRMTLPGVEMNYHLNAPDKSHPNASNDSPVLELLEAKVKFGAEGGGPPSPDPALTEERVGLRHSRGKLTRRYGPKAEVRTQHHTGDVRGLIVETAAQGSFAVTLDRRGGVKNATFLPPLEGETVMKDFRPSERYVPKSEELMPFMVVRHKDGQLKVHDPQKVWGRPAIIPSKVRQTDWNRDQFNEGHVHNAVVSARAAIDALRKDYPTVPLAAIEKFIATLGQLDPSHP